MENNFTCVVCHATANLRPCPHCRKALCPKHATKRYRFSRTVDNPQPKHGKVLRVRQAS